jgi:hypothetical protein
LRIRITGRAVRKEGGAALDLLQAGEAPVVLFGL